MSKIIIFFKKLKTNFSVGYHWSVSKTVFLFKKRFFWLTFLVVILTTSIMFGFIHIGSFRINHTYQTKQQYAILNCREPNQSCLKNIVPTDITSITRLSVYQITETINDELMEIKPIRKNNVLTGWKTTFLQSLNQIEQKRFKTIWRLNPTFVLLDEKGKDLLKNEMKIQKNLNRFLFLYSPQKKNKELTFAPKNPIFKNTIQTYLKTLVSNKKTKFIIWNPTLLFSSLYQKYPTWFTTETSKRPALNSLVERIKRRYSLNPNQYQAWLPHLLKWKSQILKKNPIIWRKHVIENPSFIVRDIRGIVLHTVVLPNDFGNWQNMNINEINALAPYNDLLRQLTKPTFSFFYEKTNQFSNRFDYQTVFIFFTLLSFLVLAILMVLYFGSWGTLNVVFNALTIVTTLAIWNFFNLDYSFANLTLLFLAWVFFNYFQFITMQRSASFVHGRNFLYTIKLNMPKLRDNINLLIVFFIISFSYFLINDPHPKLQFLNSLKISLIFHWFVNLSKPLIILFVLFLGLYFSFYQFVIYLLFHIFSSAYLANSIWVVEKLSSQPENLLINSRITHITIKTNSYLRASWILLAIILIVVLIPVFALNQSHDYLQSRQQIQFWNYADEDIGALKNYFDTTQTPFFVDEIGKRFLVETQLSSLQITQLSELKIILFADLEILPTRLFIWQWESYLITLFTIWILLLLYCLIRYNWFYALSFIFTSVLKFAFLYLVPVAILIMFKGYTNFALEPNLLFVCFALFCWQLLWQIQRYNTHFTHYHYNKSVNWCRNQRQIDVLFLLFLCFFSGFVALAWTQPTLIAVSFILVVFNFLFFRYVEQSYFSFMNNWRQHHITQKWQRFFQTVKNDAKREKEVKGINE